MFAEISIIGGGWSFAEVNHDKVPGHVIAVNDAALHFNRPADTILSMDRLWTENRWQELLKRGSHFYTRRTAVQNLEWKHLKWVHLFDNDNKSTVMTEANGILNGTNSGMCAINLAYQWRPSRLWLFGFDMCKHPATDQPYWYPKYNWAPEGGTKTGKYEAWAKQFANIATAFRDIGCSVVNVSSGSRIEAFPRKRPLDLGMELKR